MSRRATSSSLSLVGENANPPWQHFKEQCDEHAKSILSYHLWLEMTLLASSLGSPDEPDSSSSPSDSRNT